MADILEKKSTLITKPKKFSVQFLPECFDGISNTSRLEHKKQNLKVSYLIDLVHNLILKYYFKKENSFNLSSIILKDKYGHLYNYYISYLVENDILQLTKNYSKGKNSRIYKLNDNILKNKISRYKNFDKVILKKINKIYQNTLKDNNNFISENIKSRLISDLYSVMIDYDKSIFFLDTSIQEIHIYNKNKYSIDSLAQGDIFYHFDNYGRFHTNFTILKSFIRKNCLLIDGEETCELDIKNSQPLFLNKIINDNENLTMCNDEFNLYKKLTLNGSFYQYIQNALNIKEKKVVKDMIYKVFFGKNYQNKFDKSFKTLFPFIYDFIVKYKKINQDYKSLSYKLQNLESEFIFNKVINEIYKSNENIKLITCHDSIICKKSDYLIVKSIFDKYLELEFNSELISV